MPSGLFKRALDVVRLRNLSASPADMQTGDLVSADTLFIRTGIVNRAVRTRSGSFSIAQPERASLLAGATQSLFSNMVYYKLDAASTQAVDFFFIPQNWYTAGSLSVRFLVARETLTAGGIMWIHSRYNVIYDGDTLAAGHEGSTSSIVAFAGAEAAGVQHLVLGVTIPPAAFTSGTPAVVCVRIEREGGHVIDTETAHALISDCYIQYV